MLPPDPENHVRDGVATRRRRRWSNGCARRTGAAGFAALVLLVGCRGPGPKPAPPPLPMHEAVAIVNENIARIDGALRAVGSVDGRFRTPSGTARSFHVDGTLFYLPPRFLRFDLKSFGERQMLLGANAEHYWVYTPEDGYACGRHDRPGDLPSELPVRPDRFADALGLSPIPVHWLTRNGVRRVQRVEDEFQQILFLARDEAGRLVFEKEYWLDRSPPRLVRRVVFRDAEGVVLMDSRLDDYQPLCTGGPWLPHLMTAEWRATGANMRFRINSWKNFPEVGATSVQFVTPVECREPAGETR
ncbi:MAG: hypothetical protein HY763_07225 [Planctomycetes bacterium]|nr:hypothetical protein [Planctomycetota bacterium]